MMKNLLLFLLLIPALLSAQLQATKVFISRAGGNIPAVKYLLPNMDPAKAYPIVVFLHGLGEGGDGTEAGLNRLYSSGNHASLLKAAEANGFIVLAPQYVQNSSTAWRRQWQGGSEDYFDLAIEWAKANMPVDPTRIYLTGLSAGGGATWNYISSKPEFAAKIAAAVPVCGAYIESVRDWGVVGKTNLPVWAFHAKDDTAIPWTITQGYVDEINKSGTNPKAQITLYATGGHGIWGRTYSDPALYKWMLAQKNDVVPVPPVPVKTIVGRFFYGGWDLVIYSDGTTDKK